MKPITYATRALRRDWGFKLLALGGGVLLYAVALGQQNPVVKADMYVEPVGENLPSGMVLQSGPNGGAVVVSGPAKAVEDFRKQPTKATVDLAHAGPGMARLRVHYNTVGLPLEVTGLPFSEVRLEKKTNMTFAVDVVHGDDAPVGYDFEEPVASPGHVTVSGLSDDVGRVDRVVAFVQTDPQSLGGGERTVSADLVAQNIKRQVIENVEITPPNVRVTLRLKKAPATKAVLLSAQISGTPASGFAVMGCTFDPPLVTLTGTPTRLAVLSSLPVPVSVSGATQSRTTRVRLALPSGVSLVKPSSGFADVRVQLEALPSHPVPPPQTPEASPTPTVRPATPVPSPSTTPVPVAPVTITNTPA